MGNANTIFSKTLQTLRKEKGVTQEQLAGYLGVSAQAVSKWENGSYPEGDLLPRISEYFGVSISYLYGQETEKVSLEQAVLDQFKEIAGYADNGHYHPELFDKMLDLAWAFQSSFWKNNRYYFQRVVPEKEERTASLITEDAGIGFFKLNREKQFYMLMREPEEGFAENLGDLKGYRDLFRFLGTEGVLESLYYLMSLQVGEFATAATIAEKAGISEKEAEEFMDAAASKPFGGNSIFNCVKVIGSGKAYGIGVEGMSAFLSLLLNADFLLRPAMGYQLKINNRTKSWFDRETVEKLLEEGRKHG